VICLTKLQKNKWDVIIPFTNLWAQYERVIKDNGAIVLTAQDKFTAKLMLSNEMLHRYNLIWQKSRPTGFLNANRMPLRSHEDVCVFYKSLPTYNPQFSKGAPNHVSDKKVANIGSNNNYGTYQPIVPKLTERKHPKSIIEVSALNPCELLHPTQKPVALFEYLIKTYTNEGETVLDNCMGSGTTAIAAINTNRNYIGFEKEEKYYHIIQERIKKHTQQLKLIA
jgi:site-specific DNA-methyltransferase (adenine-specific)